MELYERVLCKKITQDLCATGSFLTKRQNNEIQEKTSNLKGKITLYPRVSLRKKQQMKEKIKKCMLDTSVFN